ncbi:hypothetical protein BH10PLA1_BH10PLA1_10930 [soil metagenome]
MKLRSAMLAACVLLWAVTANAAIPDQLSGDGLTVRFTNKSDTPGGTFTLGGNTYPFTGAFQGGKLVGTFNAGGQRYDFSITQTPAGFVMQTGGATYNLAVGNAAPQPNVPPGGQPPQVNPQGAAPNLTYVPQQIVDPRTRLVVATLLAPKGWTIEPGVLWREMDAQFVSLGTTVFDPQTGWAARWIPHDQFSCNPVLYDNAIRQNAAPRSIGGIEYTKTLPNALQYIQGIVLPRYRNIPGLKVVDGAELPQLAQAIDQSQPYQRWLYQQGGREMMYTAARVRVEYPSPNNVPMEEEIICVLNTSWSPQGIANARAVGAPGDYFFMPDRLFSYTAPKGQLAAAMPLMETIVLSMRADEKWVKFVDNIQGSVTSIVTNQYKMEEAANRQITASQRKSVEESWKSADQQSRDVGALISGTQARTNPNNPNGPPINGPAGMNTWTNPQGEVKNLPPGQNPNLEPGSAGNWTLAKNTAN